MTDIDFDAITAAATKKVEEDDTTTQIVEEKKEFKPDLKIWIPFGIVALAFIGVVVWTYLL